MVTIIPVFKLYYMTTTRWRKGPLCFLWVFLVEVASFKYTDLRFTKNTVREFVTFIAKMNIKKAKYTLQRYIQKQQIDIIIKILWIALVMSLYYLTWQFLAACSN